MTYIVRQEGASTLSRKLVILDDQRFGWRAENLDQIQVIPNSDSPFDDVVLVFSFEELTLPGAIKEPDPYAESRARHDLKPRYVYRLPVIAFHQAKGSS